MKIYYKLKEDIVVKLSTSKFEDCTGYLAVKEFPRLDWSVYTIRNGIVIYTGLSEAAKIKRESIADKEYTDILRKLRQSVCFDFYGYYESYLKAKGITLTEAQKTEVDAWYAKWLNITETLVIPAPPACIAAYVKTAELPVKRNIVEPKDMSGGIVYLKPTGKYEIDRYKLETDKAIYIDTKTSELIQSETEKRNVEIDQMDISDEQKLEEKASEYFPTDEQLAVIRAEWDAFFAENKENYYLKDEYGEYIEIYAEA